MSGKVVAMGLAAIVLATGAFFALLYDPPPQTVNDTAETQEETTVEVAVLENDSDPRGEPLTVVSVRAPVHGTAEIVENGRSILYTPAPGFFGADTFGYEAADPSGQRAAAETTVSVNFTPPEFHVRSQSARLEEMLNEPQTSMYGSTINVFVYRDAAGQPREITIAGHADSITCGVTSGAFASALIESGSREGDFLIAGAGRMSLPVVQEIDFAEIDDPDLRQYLEVENRFRLGEMMIARGAWSVEQAAAAGLDLDATRAELEELKAREAVRVYLESTRPIEAARGFLTQAQELTGTSGLLRIHTQDYSTVEAVHFRLAAAAREAGAGAAPRIVSFADLVAEGEAVVYSPMLAIGSAEPVTLTIPVGEFSPEGLQRAAKIHRSALEGAIVGSAERRLRHATTLLDQAKEDERQCRAYNVSEVEELVDLRSCDVDGCVPDITGRRITRREYCEVNVPRNLSALAIWKKNAEEILERMSSHRSEEDLKRIDAFTYAALIDSMLRDWALPFPQAQAAFDHWRREGREQAWRALSAALADSKISRAALSGESVAFNVSLENEMLYVRPMIAIDLKRTRIVVDPVLGALAAVTPWELRREETIDSGNAGGEDPAALAQSDPNLFTAAVFADPADVMMRLIDRQFEDLPAEGAVWSSLHDRALAEQSQMYEKHLGEHLLSARDASLPNADAAWRFLVERGTAIRAARDLPGLSPAFRAEAIFAAVRGAAGLAGAAPRYPWAIAARIVGSSNPRAVQIGDLVEAAPTDDAVLGSDARERNEQILLGDSLGNFVADVLGRLPERERAELRRLFEGTGPQRFEPRARQPEELKTVLVRIVDLVETARAAIELEQAITDSLNAYDETGSVQVSRLRSALASGDPELKSFQFPLWDTLALQFRAIARPMQGPELGPIEGQQFEAALHEAKQELTGQLRNLRPYITLVRFGRDQEAIGAKLFFDEGAYLDAYGRLFPERTPLSLYAPTLSWTPLAPTLKGLPDRVNLKSIAGGAIVVAKMGDASHDLLRLGGLSDEDSSALDGIEIDLPIPWNEGDLLWEQALLGVVPVRPEAKRTAAAMNQPGVSLAALKAMVYACAAPGSHILRQGGRCAAAEGSTRLYDRVRTGGVRFIVPADAEADAAVSQRFRRPLAWRLGAREAEPTPP